MRFQIAHLRRQFAGIAPVVIAVHQGDILAPRARKVENAGDILPPLPVLVLPLQDRKYLVRVARGIAPQNLRGAVGRGVVVDQYFNVKIAPLGEKAIQRLPKVVRVVIADRADTDERALFFLCHACFPLILTKFRRYRNMSRWNSAASNP